MFEYGRSKVGIVLRAHASVLKLILLFVSLAALACHPSVANAQAYWANNQSGYWDSFGPWAGGLPGPSANVYFRYSDQNSVSPGGPFYNASYTVGFLSNQSCASLNNLSDQVTLDLQSHTLTAGSMVVGNYYTPTGYTNSANVSMSAGTLNVTGSENIGEYGVNGSFTQSGGYHHVSANLALAGMGSSVTAGRSAASYALSGGTLIVSGGESLGTQGIATFTQSGGYNAANSLFLYGFGSTTSTYTIRAGVASFGSTNMLSDTAAPSVLNVQGGQFNVGSLNAGYTRSIINLSGGTLSTGTFQLNGVPAGTSTFNWTGGNLRINGTYSDSGTLNDDLAIPAGGAISGNYSITSTRFTVNSGATMVVGDSAPGICSVGTLVTGGSASSIANFLFYVSGTTAGSLSTNYSQLISTTSSSAFQVGGNLIMKLGYAPQIGDAYTIVHDGKATPGTAISGQFAGLAEGAVFGDSFNGINYFFSITYKGGAGNDDIIITDVIPEPGCLALVGGFCGMLMMRRRRPS
jgi:hypothetical protein